MPETLRKIALTIYGCIPEWEQIKPKVKYFAYANETCPTTGREHKQGFAYAWKPMRFKGWQDLFPGAHIEPMRGTFRDNEAYCSKEGVLVELGEKPNENGVKSSLLKFKRKLDEGASVLEVAGEDEFFPSYLQYRNGLHEYKRYKRMKEVQDDREPPKVYVRIGPPGTGKTRWMDEQFGTSGWCTAPDNTGHWFDNCDRDVILFDDVEAGQVPALSFWKRLTDRYPLQVPVKGGFITWKPKVIVFTSNSHPFQWWKELTDFDRGAIERRITEIVVVE